jgi:hypothetical protein
MTGLCLYNGDHSFERVIVAMYSHVLPRLSDVKQNSSAIRLTIVPLLLDGQ